MALRWVTSALLAFSTLTLPLLSTTHAASTPSNVFTSNTKSNNTGSSPTWQLGQQVLITWNATYDKVKLGFMQASDDSQYIPFYNGTASAVNWVVNVNKTDWAADNVVYYMVIADFDDADSGFYSKPLYIVAPGSNAPTTVSSQTQRAPTSIASAGPTVFVTITPTSAPTTTGSPTPTSTGNQQSAQQSGQGNNNINVTSENKLGSGTIAGIAVGAVAGVAALAAAVFFLLRSRKLKRQLKNSEATTHAPYMPYDQLLPGQGGAGGYTPGADKAAGLGAAAAAGGAVGAAAGGAAGYYAGEKAHAQAHDASMLGVPESNDRPVSELPAGAVYTQYPTSPRPEQEPVEIGGTELTRPMDETTPHDSRPLMGEHARDTTD